VNLWENQHAADILVTCALANHLQAYKISWDYPFNISYVASCPVEFGDTTFSVKDEDSGEEGAASAEEEEGEEEEPDEGNWCCLFGHSYQLLSIWIRVWIKIKVGLGSE